MMGVTPPDHKPAVPAQSVHELSEKMNSNIVIIGDPQERKATTSPKEYPAVRRPGKSAIKPQAKRRRQISKNIKSRKRTQDDLIAATVKSTVIINQAHI